MPLQTGSDGVGIRTSPYSKVVVEQIPTRKGECQEIIQLNNHTTTRSEGKKGRYIKVPSRLG